jgi:hypothetical protein
VRQRFPTRAVRIPRRDAHIAALRVHGCFPDAENCSFAHGASELKAVSLETREQLGLLPSAATYKTNVCTNWLICGRCAHVILHASCLPSLHAQRRVLTVLCSCKYGTRCAFVHDWRLASTSATATDAAGSDAPCEGGTILNETYEAADMTSAREWLSFTESLATIGVYDKPECAHAGAESLQLDCSRLLSLSRLPVFKQLQSGGSEQ